MKYDDQHKDNSNGILDAYLKYIIIIVEIYWENLKPLKTKIN